MVTWWFNGVSTLAPASPMIVFWPTLAVSNLFSHRKARFAVSSSPISSGKIAFLSMGMMLPPYTPRKSNPNNFSFGDSFPRLHHNKLTINSKGATYCSTLVIRFKAKRWMVPVRDGAIVAPLWLDSRQNWRARWLGQQDIVAPLWLDSRQNVANFTALRSKL